MTKKNEIFKKFKEYILKGNILTNNDEEFRDFNAGANYSTINSLGYRQLIQIKYHSGRFLLLIIFCVLCLLKLAGDITFYLFLASGGTGLVFWQIVTFLIICVPIFLYTFSAPFNESGILIDEKSEHLFKDISNLILFYLALIVIHIVFPSNIMENHKPLNLFYLILSDVFYIYIIITLIYTLYILLKWLTIRRFNRTRLYLSIILSGSLFIFLLEILKSSFAQSLIAYYLDGFSIAIIIFKVLFAVLVFLAARKNSWIAQLPKNLKHRLLWFSLLGLILSIVIASFFNEGSKFSQASALLMPGMDSLSGLILLFIIIWFFRLFISTFLFMPSTRIMERRTMDISSLVYLNKIISEAIDPNSLLKIVTNLAQSSCRADVVWIELYDKEGNITFPSIYNIEEKILFSIHHNRELYNYLIKIEKPVLFDSINGNFQLKTFFQPTSPVIIQNLNYIKSLIVVPICSGKDRIGTLLAGNKDEYAFENDDLNLLAAFRDNICIALENARLLRDSLEKEHYKRELYLAQQMQKKLLPQSVPEIKNYSVAAFSVPAEEIGGDYYDFIKLKDGSLCVIIGDVSGKGMNAAFYMAQLKGVVLSVANEVYSASELMRRINRNLYGNMDKQMFITLIAAILNPSNNKVLLARAGHTPIIFKNNNDITEIIPKGMGIGITVPEFFDENIDEVELTMKPDELILLFTDGVNELNTYEGIEYGIDSLKLFFNKTNFKDSVSLINNIQIELQSRLDGKLQHDDMTVVSIIYKGNDL